MVCQVSYERGYLLDVLHLLGEAKKTTLYIEEICELCHLTVGWTCSWNGPNKSIENVNGRTSCKASVWNAKRNI